MFISSYFFIGGQRKDLVVKSSTKQLSTSTE